MHRFRTFSQAFWYSVVLNRFSMREGAIFIPERHIGEVTTKNLVRRIPIA